MRVESRRSDALEDTRRKGRLAWLRAWAEGACSMNTRAFHISPAQCTGGERGKHSMAARFSANASRMAFIVIFNGPYAGFGERNAVEGRQRGGVLQDLQSNQFAVPGQLKRLQFGQQIRLARRDRSPTTILGVVLKGEPEDKAAARYT
ncbi:hypothetical protein VFPFJ_05922 [Purpureocillium lilacinum]|uniref:Uncharacterized protein n=1 Tax=Purpureocillium lilacinum TaxID=33203 RepID=A0A179HJ62_PURLI|nr:hypothetical protein VFPFJ_05922 [Purpureocillium lilacinum]OAQ89510.1 hypothetical protein VFPFJ_05922 [Purpureocillium lilacinum]